MNDDFARAMRLSLQETLAMNPMKATQLIQEALGGAAVPPSQQPGPPRPKITRPAFDPDLVEDAEIVAPKPQRRSFGDLIDGLSKRPAGLDLRRKPGAAAVAVPEGARFERARHDGAHGGRDYWLYVPSKAAGEIKGVVMMLHGCTQSPQDFAAGTGMNRQAESHGLVVIYPEQPRSENATLCWNWFRPSDQGAASGEPAILADIARTVAAQHDVPAGQIYVAGLSAGGAMAAILGQTHPEVFGAVGVHSGLAPGSARDVVSAFAAMRGEVTGSTRPLAVPAIVVHGLADQTVSPANGRAVLGPLGETSVRKVPGPGKAASVTIGRSAGGHPVELWEIEGAGHAWAGGAAGASYTDPRGPDASAAMVRFFLTAGPAGKHGDTAAA